MFHNCKNKHEVQALFKELAYCLDPKNGGTDELIELLYETRQIAMDIMESRNRWKKEEVLEEEFKNGDRIDRLDRRVDIIEDIMEYAHENENFDPTFTISVRKHLGINGFITTAQMQGLENVYRFFRIDDWLDRKYNFKDVDE